MHIHLPKPLHGWRALVGEIGIIVVGVLIALSAEQFTEFVHDRAQVRHGEEALSDNFRRFVTYTAELDAYAPCINARSAELRQLIDRSSIAHRLPNVGPIPQVEARPWQIDTYDAMVTSQSITHVAHSQAILYSRIAMSAIDIYDDAKVEWADWGILASLSGPSRPYEGAEEAQDRTRSCPRRSPGRPHAPNRHKHIGPDQTHWPAERCRLQFGHSRGAKNGIEDGDVQANPSGHHAGSVKSVFHLWTLVILLRLRNCWRPAA